MISKFLKKRKISNENIGSVGLLTDEPSSSRVGYFDKPDIKIRVNEVLAFACLRNEVERLPYFLEYYRNLGVNKFFIVDNNSDDGSSEFLKQQKDVQYFFTDSSYRDSAAGRHWTYELAHHYGVGNWCLTLDVDELLVYPGVEDINLIELTSYLDNMGATCLYGVFLDMYSAKPLSDTVYEPGQPFLNYCNYFDSTGYDFLPGERFPSPAIFGGPRRRAFWESGNKGNGPAQRKNVLVKWDDSTSYYHSTHSLTPQKLGDITTAVLHFKFFSTFSDLAKSELARGDRVQKADYKAYVDKIEKDDPCFICDSSAKYDSSLSLMKCGYLTASEKYIKFCKNTVSSSKRIKQLASVFEFKQEERVQLNELPKLYPFIYRHAKPAKDIDKFLICGFTGKITFFDGKNLGGWIFDSKNPHTKLEVGLFSNNEEIAWTIADKDSSFAGVNNPSKTNCSFIFDISNFQLDGTDLTVKTKNGIVVGTRTENIKIENTWKGAVDLFNLEKRTVRGWLMDSSNLEKAAKLSVYWDRKYVFDVTANEFQVFRLKNSKQPLIAQHGFSFKLPANLIDGEVHNLELKNINTSISLANSPVLIDTSNGEYEFYRKEQVA